MGGVGSAIKNVAGKVWDTAKGVAGKVADGVGWVAGKVSDGLGAVRSGVDFVKNLPIVGDVAKGLIASNPIANKIDQGIDVVRGAAGGISDTAKGIGDAARSGNIGGIIGGISRGVGIINDARSGFANRQVAF